jgi:hypothetical protein
MFSAVSGSDVAQIIEAADTFQAIVILLLLGFFALAWKYGREILLLMRGASETTEKIDKDLQTNHGSKNIGDAVDRLYEMVLDIQVTREIDSKRACERQAALERHLREVQAAFHEYVSEMKPMVAFGRERMDALLTERLAEEEQSED